MEERHQVLCIEDNMMNLRLIFRVLEPRTDIELVTEMTGHGGIDTARQLLPAVILLDLHLPDLTGVEVLDYLQADPLTADIPVIMLTADALFQDRSQIRPVFAYITKPFDIVELLSVIDDAIAIRPPAPGGRETPRAGES